MIKKTIIFVIFLLVIQLSGMQPQQHHEITHHRQEWTIILAACADLRTPVRSVCSALKQISLKNNLDLYTCKILTLSEAQKAYAFHLAKYTQREDKADIIKNLFAHGAIITTPFFLRPPYELTLYNKKEQEEIALLNSFRHPHYLVAAYFGDTDYLHTYCTQDMQYAQSISDTMGICCNTALHLAAKNGHCAAVKIILTHPLIDTVINKKNKNNQTALWLATYLGHFWITKLLLEHSSTDVTRSNKKITPLLHIACSGGHAHIVDLFIEKKPEWLNIIDKHNKTALDHAMNKGYQDIITLLKGRGAKTYQELHPS